MNQKSSETTLAQEQALTLTVVALQTRSITLKQGTSSEAQAVEIAKACKAIAKVLSE